MVRSFKPDLVLVFSNDIHPETLDELGREFRTAQLLDDHFPLDHPATEIGRRVDTFFLTMTGRLEEYRKAGVKRPTYVHSGVDPELHFREEKPTRAFVSDLAMIGKALYQDRIELVRLFRTQFDVRVYGSGWDKVGIAAARPEVKLPDFRRVCRSASIILGIDKTAEHELYFSNRTWFVLGCGGFLLTRYVPRLEALFANHRHLVWYRDFEEALELARHYLSRPEERERIALEGYRFVHAHYPFDRMARAIIDIALHRGALPPLTDPQSSMDRTPERETLRDSGES
jgi:hypothetical protein